MIEDYSKDLLRTGIIEAKAGNREGARRYLDRAIYMAGTHEVLSEAWFWMAEVTDEAGDKRKALENCLSHDLRHARARRALAILDGRLKADEIIDPDRLPPASEGLRRADARRFMCPKCGGRMSYAPDGQKLVCEYCSRGQALSSGPAVEKDFLLAMATARGHGRPLQEQVFHCNGCGAEFILPPKLISAACVYCDSPHVVSLEKTRDLLAPDGIIPHAFTQKRAVKLLIQWVEQNDLQPEKQVDLPRGLYLPLWTFDIGGEVDYTAEVAKSDEDTTPPLNPRYPVPTSIEDKYPVMMDDLPLPASRKTSAVLLKLIPAFDLTSAKPYDPRYLASWPAEIYDVPMAEASLDARSQAYQQTLREMPDRLSPMHILHTSSASLAVDSFKLILIPIWMTEIPFGGREHLVLINGQNGNVASDIMDRNAKEEGGKAGLKEFLSGLIDG
ncbi:MAG: hypothetical protein FJZ87_02835 [Chloroflexi bacterium]|nr:hypothetical protein [Chloroflexota bacterium]